ncbi:uncharacterized protein MELLADRAFT_36213, partial [Melampsora larici-populina 98AG31]
LLILFFLLAFISSWTYKLKVLNKYSFLPKPSKLNQTNQIQLDHLNPNLLVNQNQSFSAHDEFHNYLDEFLSAIRVFGFLEKPVFHELARHLQTRRLLAGDTLSLDEDKSFYIVIDGHVEVFARSNNHASTLPHHPSSLPNQSHQQRHSTYDHSLAYDHEDHNGFQLLNVVESGGTLSSLFTILSLFTEDVKLRYEDDDEDEHQLKPSPMIRTTSLQAHPHQPHPSSDSIGSFNSQLSPTFHSDPSPRSKPNRSVTLTSPIIRQPTAQSSAASRQPKHRSTAERLGAQPRESTIARATTDTTLAVIPSEAFKRLTSKFPNAVAHILQVILTRLQRVTFLTSHQYLGLTKELLRTEKAFNELACYPLPARFYEEGGMVRLRQRFLPQTKLVDEPSQSTRHQDYFGFDPINTRPSLNLRKAKDLNDAALRLKPPHSPLRDPTPKSPKESHKSHITFDLGSSPISVPIGSTNNLHEDLELRQTVMSCIAKSIGLVQHHRHQSETSSSSHHHPHQQQQVPQRPGFRSGLGSLSYLKTMGGGREDSRSSIASSSVNIDSESPADDPDGEELPNEVEILFFHQDSTLVKAGERNAGLYFVIDGFLDVFMPVDEEEDLSTGKSNEGRRRPISTLNPKEFKPEPEPMNELPSKPAPIKLFSIKPGGIAGYLASISGFPSYVDIKAKTDVYVGFLPARALESIMDRKPIVLLTLAKRLISLLSPLMLHIDSALEWMAVDAGQIIYREGDKSDNLYIVIGGRLRSISERIEGGLEILGEYGQGESIGELDCITHTLRRSTLHAIRDSELVRIPMTLFNAISIRHPAITIQVSRLIASRVRKEIDASRSNSLKRVQNNFNLKTVAIIPNRSEVDIIEFSNRLNFALESINAKTELLNQSTILSVLGRHAFSRLGKLKLTGYLAELEQTFRIVLYVADTAVNAPWTQTCIKQADYVLLVCDGGSQPELGEYERLLIGMKTTARKELVLLHPDRNVPAGSTRPWLKNRPWIHAHHHVQLAGATPLADNHLDEMLPVTALREFKERVRLQISKYARLRSKLKAEPVNVTGTDDFARLARRLCGKSIGVVLGGGGARGISHIGVIRALSEIGMPIDMIGGTSIGSFIGGLYARNSDLISTLGRAKVFSGRMATLWRILTDITYPVVAYTTGHEFNRGIYKSFYDYHIEDFWLPFWANTTNITWSRMEVHTTGYAWRYIRASMSLAGLLPPLCDDGDMLVDGGYIDNLPVSVMLRMGADSIFAVDVGSIDDTSPRNFPESLSGWWLLISRMNPWSENHRIPTMTDIQSRLTYVSSVKTLEEAKATPGVLYMRMPVTEYTTMDFGKFEVICQKGYEAAKEMLKEWKEMGALPDGLERKSNEMNRLDGQLRENERKRLMVRRNSV